MKSLKSYILLVGLCCFCFFGFTANAIAQPTCGPDDLFIREGDTVYACSCSQGDVKAAINAANGGDTVVVPAGSCTWPEAISANSGITIQGSGIDTTIIECGGDFYLFDLEVGHNQPIRITGFTFDGNNGTGKGIRAQAYSGQRKNLQLRIDHNKFVRCTAASVAIGGWIYGVIDHNQFENPAHSVISMVCDGQGSWDRAGEGGTADAVYIEDNAFTYHNSAVAGHCVAANGGGRYVFRYNTVNTTAHNTPYDPVDAHGYCGNPHGGTYLIEVYENVFNMTDGGSIGRGINVRGGRGVIFNNTFNGPNNEGIIIRLVNYRSCLSSSQGNSCDPIGNTYCGDYEGYPCKHQVNNMYIWNNTHNNVVKEPYVHDCDLVREHIQEGRDFYNREPNIIDDGVTYTPYTYPHPLSQTTVTGDVNNDASINIQDIQACVNHILGTQSYAAADVNGDGPVNVLDVQEIVNIILG